MNELERSYKALGLEFGASLEEVNQAYKDLVFIWHPDRIPKDNPRLQQKAQEKLKELNDARDRLRSYWAETPSKATQTNSRPAQKRPQPHASSPSHYPHHTYQSYQHRREAHYPPYEPPKAAPTPKAAPAPPAQPKKQPPDLSGANFSGANLRERDFSGRNLSEADLSHANLSDAFLHNVNLSGANLFRANLFRANLLQANLRNAKLQEANLIGADLSGADLTGADLSDAKMSVGDRLMVKLTGANLTGATLPDGSTYE